MKNTRLIAVTILLAFAGGSSIAYADELRSLRGSRALDDLSMTPARARVILPDEGVLSSAALKGNRPWCRTR